MSRMLRERMTVTACAFAILLVFAAVSPRPARPAVPARPVSTGVLSGYVICVDAGHGGIDGGARARESLVWEREINLQVAKKVCAALEEAGARVIMTREDEKSLHDDKRTDLLGRIRMAQQAGADLLLSIHMNEYRSRQASGPQVFYQKGDGESRLLAAAVQKALVDGLQPKWKRAALEGDYLILTGGIPSVLVECGFISNREEELLLLDEGYQSRIAHAVVQGVTDFCLLPK